MSSEEIEADAWASFSDSYRVIDDLDALEEYVIVDDDTHKEPLYSAETIQDKAESFCDKLDYQAKNNLSDSEKQRLEDVKSEIRKFAEVFSSNEQ
jgi:hypothetical protein